LFRDLFKSSSFNQRSGHLQAAAQKESMAASEAKRSGTKWSEASEAKPGGQAERSDAQPTSLLQL
jgi:hypothetical protein